MWCKTSRICWTKHESLVKCSSCICIILIELLNSYINNAFCVSTALQTAKKFIKSIRSRRRSDLKYSDPQNSTLYCDGDSRLLLWKLVWKILGLPWKSVWNLRGLPWKYVWKFCSRNYFQVRSPPAMGKNAIWLHANNNTHAALLFNCSWNHCNMLTATHCNTQQHFVCKWQCSCNCNTQLQLQLQHTTTQCKYCIVECFQSLKRKVYTSTTGYCFEFHCKIEFQNFWICFLTRRTWLHFLHLELSGKLTNCNTLQHNGPRCITLLHTAPHCTALHRTAPHCSELHHTATLCTTTLHHTTLHCTTLHHAAPNFCHRRPTWPHFPRFKSSWITYSLSTYEPVFVFFLAGDCSGGPPGYLCVYTCACVYMYVCMHMYKHVCDI